MLARSGSPPVRHREVPSAGGWVAVAQSDGGLDRPNHRPSANQRRRVRYDGSSATTMDRLRTSAITTRGSSPAANRVSTSSRSVTPRQIARHRCGSDPPCVVRKCSPAPSGLGAPRSPGRREVIDHRPPRPARLELQPSVRCARANGHPMRQVLRLDPTGSRSPTNRAPFVAAHSWRTPQSFGDVHRTILPERTVTALHRGVPVVCHLCVNCPSQHQAFPSQIPPDSPRHVELTSRPSRSGTSTTKKWPIGVHRDCRFECLTPCEQRQQPMRPPRVAVRPQSLDVLDLPIAQFP